MLDLPTFQTDLETLNLPLETWKLTILSNVLGEQFPCNDDSKLVSSAIQEITRWKVIVPIALQHGYKLETAPEKVYPDFTLTRFDSTTVVDRIALDVKTMYMETAARTEWKRKQLALGGYGSFLRDDEGMKNILYPYDTYKSHWVFVVAYERVSGLNGPYRVLSVAIRKKHEITGLKPGSGNTTNIGSIYVRTPDELKIANGVFNSEVFVDPKAAADHYWRNYPRYPKSEGDLIAHPDFSTYRS